MKADYVFIYADISRSICCVALTDERDLDILKMYMMHAKNEVSRPSLSEVRTQTDRHTQTDRRDQTYYHT